MWQWLFQFVEPLEAAGIDYAIVGSVASSIYGEPRATNDIDLVIQLRAEDAGRLSGAFDEARFYVPPEEVIRVELARSAGAHLNVIALDDMTKADLYPLPIQQKSWFARRRKIDVAGRGIWLAAPEVVILNKLIFHRAGGGEKHLRDIRAMQTASATPIDTVWLCEEAMKLGLQMPDA